MSTDPTGATDRALGLLDILFLLSSHAEEWNAPSIYPCCLVARNWAIPFTSLLWRTHGHILHLASVLGLRWKEGQYNLRVVSARTPRNAPALSSLPSAAVVERFHTIARYISRLTDLPPKFENGLEEVDLSLLLMDIRSCVERSKSRNNHSTTIPRPLFPSVHSITFRAPYCANPLTLYEERKLASRLDNILQSVASDRITDLQLLNRGLAQRRLASTSGAEFDLLERLPTTFPRLKKLHFIIWSGQYDEERAISILQKLIAGLQELRSIDIVWPWAFTAQMLSCLGQLRHLNYFRLGGAPFISSSSFDRLVSNEGGVSLRNFEEFRDWTTRCRPEGWFPKLEVAKITTMIFPRFQPLQFLGNRLTVLDVMVQDCSVHASPCAAEFHRRFFRVLSNITRLRDLQVDIYCETEAICSTMTAEDIHQLKKLEHLEKLSLSGNGNFEFTSQDIVESSEAWSRMLSIEVEEFSSTMRIYDRSLPTWEHASESELEAICPRKRGNCEEMMDSAKYPNSREVPTRLWTNMPLMNRFLIQIGPYRATSGGELMRWCGFSLGKGYYRLGPRP